jgi:hypothetical protein
LEIWEQALINSISYTFLPSSDDTLVRIFLLFEHKCDAHREAEKVRGRLRLVCRLWNDILKEIPIQYVYWVGGLISQAPQSPLRIDIEELQYDCALYEKRFPVKNKASGQWRSVEALIDQNPSGRIPDLGRFPNLRLLSTNYFNPNRVSSKHPTLLQNLTHLQIPLIYSKQSPSGGLILPKLHTLSIDFGSTNYCTDDDPDQAGSYDLDTLNWSLPSLKNLGCFGRAANVWTDTIMRRFIEIFGPKLEGIYIGVYEQVSICKLWVAPPRNLWKTCTRLRTLWTSLINFRICNERPDDRPPLRLIFCDVSSAHDWKNIKAYFMHERDWEPFYFPQCLSMALDWSIGDFEMDTSWKDLPKVLQGASFYDLEMLFEVLDRIDQEGRDLKDKNGEGMKSEVGKEFMDFALSRGV